MNPTKPRKSSRTQRKACRVACRLQPRSLEPHGDHYHKTNNHLVFVAHYEWTQNLRPTSKDSFPAGPASSRSGWHLYRREGGHGPCVQVQILLPVQPPGLGPRPPPVTWPPSPFPFSPSFPHPTMDKHTPVWASLLQCVRQRWMRREEHSPFSIPIWVPFRSQAAILDSKEGIPWVCIAISFQNWYMETIEERDPGGHSPTGKTPALKGWCHLFLLGDREWVRKRGKCGPPSREGWCYDGELASLAV